MGVRDTFIDATKKLQQQSPTNAPSDETKAEREAIQEEGGTIPPPPDWPKLGDDALYGLAGDVVHTIDPHTEADPVAILAHFLVFFGNCVGPSPHFRVGGDEHPAKLFIALVGESSFARKGTSEGQVRRIFERVDMDWAKKRIVHGLASGEGLIKALQPEGVSADPRMIAIEPEMANVLKAMRREGSTLSGVLRQAWDSGDLRVMTRKDPLAAIGTHLSIVTHVSGTELVNTMEATEGRNGFANRFLWLLVRRSKYLPDGNPIPTELLDDLARRTALALDNSRRLCEVKRDAESSKLWRILYSGLTARRLGLAGAVSSRAHVQVIRLALIYALLDSSQAIGEPHLRAAVAFWEFAAQCTKRIFGERTGNRDADRLWQELKDSEKGEITREEAYEILGRNISSSNLDAAVLLLVDNELLRIERRPQPVGRRGRPTEAYVRR